MESLPQTPKVIDPITAERNAVVRLGRGFQPEFLEMVASQAWNTAYEQLEKLGVPESVLNLLTGAALMKSYVTDLKHGSLDDMFVIDLVDILPNMTRQIWDLGGEFTDGESAWRKDV